MVSLEPSSDTSDWLRRTNTFTCLHPSFDSLCHTSIFDKHVKPLIIPQLAHDVSRQCCFMIIGDQLRLEHFGLYENKPQILLPPYMVDSAREKLLAESRRDLTDGMLKSMAEGGFHDDELLAAFSNDLSAAYKSQLETFRKAKVAARIRQEESKRKGRSMSLEVRSDARRGGGVRGKM
jgi:hypothetical protein